MKTGNRRRWNWLRRWTRIGKSSIHPRQTTRAGQRFEPLEPRLLLAVTPLNPNNPVVTLQTNLGPVPVELFADKAPVTVNNFLNYVNDGDYANTFFHRFVPNFVLQGGGFKSSTASFADPSVNRQFTALATDPAIQNEFDNWAKASGSAASITPGSTIINLGTAADLTGIAAGDRIRLTGRIDGLSNTDMFDIVSVDAANKRVTVQQTPTGQAASNVAWRIFPKVNTVGTLAMAKTGGNPNSATSQFFINLTNNDANLDLQNGGFTVFGQILDETFLTQVSTLNDLSLFSANLTGTQQVPPVTTSGSGTADLALNKRNNQFDLSLSIQGLQQSNLTGSQIRLGATGQAGSSIFDLGAGAQYVVNGTQLQRFVNNGAFPGASVTPLQASGTYINVSTTANAQGELRGQLTPVQGGIFSDLPTTSSDQLLVIQSITGEGFVKGTVFTDTDRDSVRDAGETGRSAMTVYADLNSNNQLDSGEPSATTDANGGYSLKVSAGTHKIRLAPASGIGQTLAAAGYDVQVLIGREVTARDFGVVALATPTAVDLVAVTDSGTSNGDNITNFNNSSVAKALQFLVTGVTSGAIVRVLADGVVIGQATVPSDATTATITTNGTTTLNDGSRAVTATQEVGGVVSQASPALTVKIDTTLAAFTSTPPTSATVGAALSYNAENPEEGQANFTYTLQNAPTGAAIHASTGVVTWTPNASQIGEHPFQVVATDAAGNTRSQPLTIQVTKTPQIKFNYQVTDTNGNAITQINIGQTFQLRAFVEDVRPTGTPQGVFAAYQDVTFDASRATATTITHASTFGQAPTGTIKPGEIDEVGSFAGSLQPIGAGPHLLYTATFTASRSGVLTFTGNAPDVLPAHALGLYGINVPVPIDEVVYGSASVTVINPNFIAGNDSATVNEDSSNNTINVLSNDQGSTGSTLTIAAVGATNKGGTVAIAADGKSLRYTPAANFFGQETFTYTVSDGSDQAVATVTVQVTEINDPPVVVNDVYSGANAVEEDSPGVTLNVLQNDLAAANPDAGAPQETLRIVSVSAGSHGGTITIGASGANVTYKPAANFFGTETFTYTVSDRAGTGGLTATATATVTVTAKNDNPTAANDTFTAEEDSTNNVFDVLANDSSAPDSGETLTITAVGAGSRGGQVTIVEAGKKVRYTPAANVFGTETFTYTISDGNGGTATATVTVNLTAKNDPPDARDDAVNVAKNSQNNLIDVLLNDLIAPDENETLVVSAVTQGNQGGAVEIVENGTKIRYKPKADYVGTETFTYTIRDPGGLTDTATVTVTVRNFQPSSLAGFVYLDANNDGVKDSGEQPLANVKITLTGADDFGAAVNRETTTDATGAYKFENLAPGNYKLKQTQPTGSINNLPITDGQDTIGSQGGTVSANDELTIRVNENVNGTGNNFGELTGYRVGGKLQGARPGPADSVASLAGAEFKLFAVNSQNQATGNALKTVKANPDGSFVFDGIAAGKYVAKLTPPTFLAVAQSEKLIEVSAGDSLNNVFHHGGRHARYISFRDFMNQTPRDGVFASTGPGDTAAEWSTTHGSWTGLQVTKVALAADSKTVRLEVTKTTGEKLFDEVPATDPRVHILSQNGTKRLIELAGTSTQYNLRPIATTAASAAGSETGEGEAFRALSADAEGEGSGGEWTLNAAPILVNSLASEADQPVPQELAGESVWFASTGDGDTRVTAQSAEGEASTDDLFAAIAEAIDMTMAERGQSESAETASLDDEPFPSGDTHAAFYAAVDAAFEDELLLNAV